MATGDADLKRLLRVLPGRITERLNGAGADMVELALDLGKPPAVRYAQGFRMLAVDPVEKDDIRYIIDRVGMFRRNNRAGVDGTLHRVSVIRDRYGDPLGLTIRIGRHLPGVADAIADILADDRASLLLIGPPGAGKTTLLRDCARVLAERLGPGVIIVDSHNEIGGDGSVPHPAIGAARRMQVPDRTTQHEIMLEAVRNHFPDVVIIDEIGSRGDAEAARAIARRGIRLIATAHGETLGDVARNPDLASLVGGVEQVALKAPDPMAQLTGRQVAQQRLEPPAMGTAIEVRVGRRLALYTDVGKCVDALHGLMELVPDDLRDIPAARPEQASPLTTPARTA